jgi:ketosteroid isomerase-like protein
MIRKLVLSGIGCVVLAGLCLVYAQENHKDAEAYIIESERQWAESVASGDSSVIERILADDFIGVDPEGKQYNKAQMVADTKNAPKYFASNHLNEVKVRFYGDAAVAQGNESWVRRTGTPKQGRFVWTDTWIKRGGKWQIVAAEDLTVSEDPK